MIRCGASASRSMTILSLAVRLGVMLGFLGLSSAQSVALPRQDGQPRPGSGSLPAPVAPRIARLPLHFEADRGQAHATGPGIFGVATSNVGAVGDITVSADTGGATLPIDLFVCQTNPATGECLQPLATSVTGTIAAGATPTSAPFAQGTGNVAFNPGANRPFMRFKQRSLSVGATSAALRTSHRGRSVHARARSAISLSASSVSATTVRPVIPESAHARYRSRMRPTGPTSAPSSQNSSGTAAVASSFRPAR